MAGEIEVLGPDPIASALKGLQRRVGPMRSRATLVPHSIREALRQELAHAPDPQTGIGELAGKFADLVLRAAIGEAKITGAQRRLIGWIVEQVEGKVSQEIRVAAGELEGSITLVRGPAHGLGLGTPEHEGNGSESGEEREE